MTILLIVNCRKFQLYEEARDRRDWCHDLVSEMRDPRKEGVASFILSSSCMRERTLTRRRIIIIALAWRKQRACGTSIDIDKLNCSLSAFDSATLLDVAQRRER